jgi:hypothetical protein
MLRNIKTTPNCQVTIETITPEQASNYLGDSIGTQRTIKETLVLRLIHDLKNDNWELNGAAICFGPNGELLDGQHRLIACMRSGIPIRTVVVRGLPPSSFATIDSGIARSLADVLHTLGYIHCTAMSSVLRRLVAYRTHDNFMDHSRIAKVTVADALQLLENQSDLPEFIRTELTDNRKLLLTPSIYLTIMAILRDTAYAETSKEFFDEVFNDLVLNPQYGNPAHLLRARLIKARLATVKDKMSTYMKAALTIKAWNAWVTDNEMYQLRFKRFGKYAEQFPAIFPYTEREEQNED